MWWYIGFFTTGVCCFASIANSVLINCILLELFIRHNAHYVCCTHWSGFDRSNLSAWPESWISNGFILYTLHSIPGGYPPKLPCPSVLSAIVLSKNKKMLCNSVIYLMVIPLSSEKNTSVNQYIPWKCCSFSFYQFQAMQEPA